MPIGDKSMEAVERVSDPDVMRQLGLARKPFICSTYHKQDLSGFLESYGACQVQISDDEFSLPTTSETMSLRSYFESSNLEPDISWSSETRKRPYVFHDVMKEDEGPLSEYLDQAKLPK